MTAPADWVLAVERAYVTAAMGGDTPTEARTVAPAQLARARAAAGAVASRYLAVGTPRSLGLVLGGIGAAEAAAQSLEAHRSWFAPRDLRCAGEGAEALAAQLGGRATTVAEALACDIVCVHGPLHLAPAQLRRGTHVNVLDPAVTLDPELAQLAQITHEEPGLGAVAAGLVDGRQLDEITLFVIGSAAIALAAV